MEILTLKRDDLARNLDFNTIRKLYQISKENKIDLMFLNALKDFHPWLHKIYQNKLEKFCNMQRLLVKVTNSLLSSEVEFVVFKTVRPFLATPADIDILVLRTNHFSNAVRTLKKRGLAPLVESQHETTLISQEHRLNVDLYVEIVVLDLIYIDKKTFLNHVSNKNILGTPVPILDAVCELVVVLSHALFKEQMFTLADYYTAKALLRTLEKTKLIHIAKQTHTTRALGYAFSLITLLEQQVFGDVTFDYQELNTRLGGSIRFKSSDNKIVTMPFRIDWKMLASLLFSKFFEDPRFRSSVMNFLPLVSPGRVGRRVIDHIFRNTY